MSNERLIPWDVIIEILNKYQSYNPGLAAERVNKYVNDEIYEWVNNHYEILSACPSRLISLCCAGFLVHIEYKHTQIERLERPGELR